MKKDEESNVPKTIELDLSTNIFLSVKGNNNNPIKIIKGSFTASHAGIYIGSRLLENIHLPNVNVHTLLK